MITPPRARALGLLLTAALLSACGGGSHPQALPAVPGGSGQPTVASESAIFSFSIRKYTPSSRIRPQYVSSATKSITVQVTDTKNSGTSADIYANVPAGLKVVQTANFANLTGNGSVPGQCGTDPTNTGNFKCTASFQLPVGTNAITIASWDANGGTGNKLSQQQTTVTTLQGVANQYAISLDANAATMTVSGTAACTNGGAIGATFGSVGTTPAVLTVGFTDAAGKTIVAPGLPTIEVQDNASTYQSASGTLNGTGGTVGFAINQTAQTITLTPSAGNITNVSVNVKAVPANSAGSSDGLSFATTKSFTFSTGVALPSGSLAVIEQTGGSSGKIDLYTVSLGGSDSFTPYSVPTLASTLSVNEGKADVDNPRAMLFDSSGNLLIANGGQGGSGGDFGDFACVPAGAISTGASTSTTTSTSASDPESIEIGSNGSVVIGNVTASATFNTVGYTLAGVYTAASSYNITNSGSVGTFDVLALPTASQPGTYAAAITNGTSISRVAIKTPGGSEIDLTDPTINSPHALGWDSANAQIVIASQMDSNFGSYLDFYTVAGTKVKSVLIRDDGSGISSLLEGDKVAVSPNGYVAVGGVGVLGLPEVQIYDNTATRAAVGGPIPFDACVDSGCASNVYGTNPVITSLHFLSNTKLLVTLSDSSMTSKQGVYTFDITQLSVPCTCYDPVTSGLEPTSPLQTGFLNFGSNPPLGAAYKP